MVDPSQISCSHKNLVKVRMKYVTKEQFCNAFCKILIM